MNAKQMPLVCIIMPVYNGENTIHYALNSIVRQTYENWICVIVNDGSTDRTKEILDTIEDKRFKIVHLSHNCGRGAARDEALNRAEGKYLAYLDADDMMHKDKIKTQVEFMESHPEFMLVSCGGITYNDKFKALCTFNLKSFESVNIMQYGQALPLTLGASMARLDHAKIFSYNHKLNVGEDYDYFARYCEGYRYANIGQSLYYYQTGNVTSKKILYYQFSILKSVGVHWKMGLRLKALTLLFTSILKIAAYAFLLLFVKANKLAEIRLGGKITNEMIEEFDQETATIRQLSRI